jgi:hypothetical protein
VPVNIAQWKEQLLELSDAAAPGLEFCEAIAELGRTNRLAQLSKVLPAIVYDELCERYRSNPEFFVQGWRSMAVQMRHGFVDHARDRLTSLIRLRRDKTEESTPTWQQIQRALDAQQNDLLRTAFALELLDMIEPAVARATNLRECVVNTPSSDEADRYLDEATRCYFYGLYTACAVMCRSVLEEAVKQKLPQTIARQIRSRYRNTATLGNLLHEVNNNLQMTGIDPDFPRVANQVNDVGKRAVHQELLTEDEARHCLQSARKALELLLNR